MADASTDGPLTAPSPNDSTSLIPQSSVIVTTLQAPLQDLNQVWREASAFLLFWNDVSKRPKARAHQAIIILSLVIAIIEIVSCALMEAEAREAHVFRHYVIVERGIALCAQVIFSIKGSIVENGGLLIIANLNAVGIVIRTAMKVMLFDVPNYVLLALVAAATLAHLVATVFVFIDGLQRFEVYMIGAEVHILRMYREYRFFNALSLLDLETSLLATATMLFFMEDYDKHWYWFILFAVLVFLVAAMKALMRKLIRAEANVASFSFVVPFYLMLPAAVLAGYYKREFLGINVDDDSRPLVEAAIVSFLIARVALLFAASKCFYNFGNGMKQAFENERDGVDFVREEAARQAQHQRMYDDLLRGLPVEGGVATYGGM